MGTIQSSINTMLGTVAGAAAAAKHLSNQSKQVELEEAKLPEEMAETDKALEEAQDEKESILQNNPELGAPGADTDSPEYKALLRATNRADMLIKAKSLQLSLLEKRFNSKKEGNK